MRKFIPLMMGLLVLSTTSLPLVAADPPASEAIDICEDKEIGDLCAYTGEEGTEFNGSCELVEDNQQSPLYCKVYN